MIKCPECGAYIPDGGRICLTCGYKPEKENARFDENGPFDLFGELFEQAEKLQGVLPHDDSRRTAALSYLGPAFVYTYAKNRDNEFICYHADQACSLFAAHLLAGALDKLPLFGGLLKKTARAALSALAFTGARNAFQNKKEPVPYIGELGIRLLK